MSPPESSKSCIDPEGFAERLLGWFDVHGRKSLPWQENPTPYRVWVSEVMLQQTQVATVIPYYLRFVERFPRVEALATAPIDEVLHLWTGLGYYARARNLHRCAQVLIERHGGTFPRKLEEVTALPGIGRSTAGAILALSRGERHPILDGNAKRVLARVFGVDGDPASAAVLQALWERADACTPTERAAAYTQAIMDLGATLCTRTRPACTVCPMNQGCIAAREGRQAVLPGARQRRERRAREAVLLLAESGEAADRAVLVERRPSSGVWGGLWSPPQFASEAEALEWCRRELGTPQSSETLAPIDHAFTHFDLRLNPLRVRCAAGALGTLGIGRAAGAGDTAGAVGTGGAARAGGAAGASGAAGSSGTAGAAAAVRESDDRLWYVLGAPPKIGLPQPIHELFARMRTAGARLA